MKLLMIQLMEMLVISKEPLIVYLRNGSFVSMMEEFTPLVLKSVMDLRLCWTQVLLLECLLYLLIKYIRVLKNKLKIKLKSNSAIRSREEIKIFLINADLCVYIRAT